MAVTESIKTQGLALVILDELAPDIEFWVKSIDTLELYPGGKTFLEPQVCPPVLRNQRCEVRKSGLYTTESVMERFVSAAAKTVHMGQNKNFEMTTWSYLSAFPEQCVLYLKVLATLVPEI